MSKKFSEAHIRKLRLNLKTIFWKSHYKLLTANYLKKELGFNDIGNNSKFNWGSFLSLMIKNKIIEKTDKYEGYTSHRHPNFLYKFIGKKNYAINDMDDESVLNSEKTSTKKDDLKNLDDSIDKLFQIEKEILIDINEEKEDISQNFVDVNFDKIEYKNEEEDFDSKVMFIKFPNGDILEIERSKFSVEIEALIIASNKFNKKLKFSTLITFE